MLCQDHEFEVKDVFRCNGFFTGDYLTPEVGVIISDTGGKCRAVKCDFVGDVSSISLDDGKGNVSLKYSQSVFIRFGVNQVYAIANDSRALNDALIKRCKFESFSKSGWKQIDDRDLDRILHWNDNKQKEKEFKYNDRLKKAEEVLGNYDFDDDYELDMQ